ncbi:MAG: GntR family transcriptional regulator [Bacillota bacterium]
MKEKQTPKYLQLKQEILSWIHSGKLKPDEKMPSENEIVNQFQISRHTVRQTLGVLEKEGWLYKVQGRGTFVAQPNTKENNENKTIAIITTYISDYIFPHIVRGAEGTIRNNGYHLMLSSTDNDKEKEKESLKMLMSQPLKGLIIEPTKSAQGNTNLNYFLALEYQHIPFVMINEKYQELNCPTIKVDDEEGGFLAAEHLIQLGHTNILGFFKTDDLQGINRLKGFIQAHKKFQVPLRPNSVIHYTTEDKYGDFFQKALSKLLKHDHSERPTAIVCYNDQLAIHIMEIVRSFSLNIPDDMSIVGFDDSSIATATEVKLTTLSHPKSHLGEQAANLLIEMIEKKHKNQPEDIVFKPELIVRGSTTPIKTKH